MEPRSKTTGKQRPEGFEKHPERINRKGRPKVGNTVAELARAVLEAVPKGQNRSRGQIILEKFAEIAEAGSAPHANFLFDRGFGKPQESMTLSGGLSLYEQGAREQTYDPQALLEAMKRLSGTKK